MGGYDIRGCLVGVPIMRKPSYLGPILGVRNGVDSYFGRFLGIRICRAQDLPAFSVCGESIG